MQLSVPDKSFLDSFEHIKSFSLDKYDKNKMNIFMLRVNANEFDYDLLIRNLLEPVITYSVSRQLILQLRYEKHLHQICCMIATIGVKKNPKVVIQWFVIEQDCNISQS